MAKKVKTATATGAAEVKVPLVVDATSSELQANFGKYVDVVEAGGTVIVTKNGKRIMRLVPAVEIADGEIRTPILEAIRKLQIRVPVDWEAEKERYFEEKYGKVGM